MRDARGEDDFLASFAGADPTRRYVDVSPAYFIYSSEVIDRMAAILADWDMRRVVCLRHPVHQAYSHYNDRLAAYLAP